MQYSPIQLEAIKLFGKKDLTEGCLVITSQCDKDGTPLCDRDFTIIPHIELAEIDGNKYHRLRHWNLGGIEYEEYSILGHIPHFERILEVLYEKDIAVTLSNMHKKSIVLDFLNEKDDECKIREIDYDWTKELFEQDEKVLKELIEIVENAK